MFFIAWLWFFSKLIQNIREGSAKWCVQKTNEQRHQFQVVDVAVSPFFVAPSSAANFSSCAWWSFSRSSQPGNTSPPWKMMIGRRSFPFGMVYSQGQTVKLPRGKMHCPKNSKMVVEEIFRQSQNVHLVGFESSSNGRLTAMYTNTHLLFTAHIYHVRSNNWIPYVRQYIQYM